MIQFLAKNLAHPLIPYLCLIGSGVLVGLTLPLNASLWLDETLSAWVSNASLPETLYRAYTYQGQPPFYFTLIWLVQWCFGFQELYIRIPSLLAALTCLWLLYRLAREYGNSEAASMAPLFLIANDEFHKFALSARPYTLALAMSLGALLLLLRSQQRNSTLSLYSGALLIAIALYLHPAFIIFLPIPVLLVYSERSTIRSLFKDLTTIVLTVLISLVPLFAQLLALAVRNQELYFANIPNATRVIQTIFSPFPVVAFLTAFLCTAIFFKSFKFDLKKLYNKKLLVLTTWLLLAPILFSVHAYITGNSLFLPRIMFWRLPALALIAAIVVSAISPRLVRNFCIILFSFLTVTVYSIRPWHLESWREVVAMVTKDTHRKVALFSGLIELDQLDWVKNRTHHAYLTAPFSVYAPAYPNTILLPRNPHATEAKHYLQSEVVPQLHTDDYVVLIKSFRHNPPAYGVHEALHSFFIEHGFTFETIESKKLIEVYRITGIKSQKH